MNEYYNGRNEEQIREEELAEAEQMVRNGCNMRQLMRRQFTFVGQSDIFKLYRKYGADPEQDMFS